MRNRSESDVVCLLERAAQITSGYPPVAQDVMFNQDAQEAERRLLRLEIQLKRLAQYNYITASKRGRLDAALDAARPHLLALSTVLNGLSIPISQQQGETSGDNSRPAAGVYLGTEL